MYEYIQRLELGGADPPTRSGNPMKPRLGIWLAVCCAVLLAACRRGPALPAEEASLRENLPQLEAAAKAWRPDAYLDDADIPLHDGNPSPWLIPAEFNSPTTDFQSLGVPFSSDMRIHTVAFLNEDAVSISPASRWNGGCSPTALAATPYQMYASARSQGRFGQKN